MNRTGIISQVLPSRLPKILDVWDTLGEVNSMGFRKFRTRKTLVVGTLILVILASSVGVAWADCSSSSGWLAAVILTWNKSLCAWNSSIDTWSDQAWGAPRCYIQDQHFVNHSNGAYWGDKSWTSYASVDNGVHPGPKRYWNFNAPGGTWKVVYTARRYSGHDQLWGIAPSLGHYWDAHSAQLVAVTLY